MKNVLLKRGSHEINPFPADYNGTYYAKQNDFREGGIQRGKDEGNLGFLLACGICCKKNRGVISGRRITITHPFTSASDRPKIQNHSMPRTEHAGTVVKKA